MIDLDRLVDIAVNEEHVAAELVREHFQQDTFGMVYYGVVKAKERPRSGKGGRMYTPTETRKFEAAVYKWAKAEWDRKPLIYPIRVELTIFELGDDQQENDSTLGLIYNEKGDIDNLAKSVLDGMNGVVYKDDKQIVDLDLTRRFSMEPGFNVVVTRAGLTKMEYKNFCKRRARREAE